MDVLYIFVGFLIFLSVVGLIGVFYLSAHPEKQQRSSTAITYNLDTHKFGLVYGLPVQEDDEILDELDDEDEPDDPEE